MSQIVRAITARDTGNRKVDDSFSQLFKEMVVVKEQFSERERERIFKEYKIGVTLENSVLIDNVGSLKSQEKCIETAIENTRSAVIEAIFGEFRSDFIRLHISLSNRDYLTSLNILAEFQNKMFSAK